MTYSAFPCSNTFNIAYLFFKVSSFFFLLKSRRVKMLCVEMYTFRRTLLGITRGFFFFFFALCSVILISENH